MPSKYVAAFAAVLAAFAGTSSNLSAQHTGMPGMPGMADTTKSHTTKTKATTKKPPTKKKTASRPTAKAKTKSTAAPKRKVVTTKATTPKPALHPGMAGMSGTPGMASNPDSAHPAMSQPGDTARHSMPSMPGSMPTTHSDPAMGSMPGMRSDSSVSMTTMPGMAGSGMGHMMAGPLGIPMDRMGSGTTWIPDALSLPSRHRTVGQWDIMTHGFVFGQYDKQGGRRGDSQLGSLNWIMMMASRQVAGGHFQARTMLSLDPATVTPKGYPLLLQSGEAYKGEPLHDRQHPHDFLMEVGALYQREFNKQVAWSIYAAPSGEPALGPVAFMHRPSAMDNPSAPIGHHWQDATHITYGVVTAGYSFGKVKFEASAFNGTEPDENRWNFDRPRLNSFSGRLSVNPTKNWSLQISQGYLRNPERSEPEVRILRKTIASAIYNKKFDDEHNWETSLVWGRNYANREGTNSFLAESNYDFNANAVFGRFETVQKSGHDLVLPAPFHEHDVFNVSKFSIGYVRDVVRNKGIDIGIGGMITANFNPSAIAPVYGGTRHGGWQLFVRFRPSKMH